MALIEIRSFLKYHGLYAVIAIAAAAFAQRLLPEPTSSGLVASYGFAFFFLILTVGLPLLAVYYSALNQSLRARRIGWFLAILFTFVIGAYIYALWVHEPQADHSAA
jgi:hypothetical protein